MCIRFLPANIQFRPAHFSPQKIFVLGWMGELSGSNNDFDFDKSLDLDTSDNVFALEFTWRFGKKWSARFHYFATDQSEKAVLEEDIQWGDEAA